MAGVFYADGNYTAEVIDLAFEESDSNTQIVLKVKVMEQWDHTTGQWVPCANQYDRTIWLRIPEEEEYRKYIALKLRNAGWNGDKFETLRDDMLGKSIGVMNKARVATGGKYAGQTIEGWDLPLPQRESKPLENKPQVAKKLNALFGKVLKETPKLSATTDAPEPLQEQPVGAAAGAPPNDEVPF